MKSSFNQRYLISSDKTPLCASVLHAFVIQTVIFGKRRFFPKRDGTLRIYQYNMNRHFTQYFFTGKTAWKTPDYREKSWCRFYTDSGCCGQTKKRSENTLDESGQTAYHSGPERGEPNASKQFNIGKRGEGNAAFCCSSFLQQPFSAAV